MLTTKAAIEGDRYPPAPAGVTAHLHFESNFGNNYVLELQRVRFVTHCVELV